MNTMYNFEYLLDLQMSDTKNYELNQIINAIDKECENPKYDATSRMLFHIVPIMYSFSIISGLAMFVNILLN